MELCYEWFIFDFKLSSGQTVLELFQQECYSALSDYEKTLLNEWRKTYISLYEVKRILPGRKIVVNDLLIGGKLKVNVRNPETKVAPGDILFLRVLKIGGEYELSNGGLVLPAEYKISLLRRLQANYRSSQLERGSSRCTIEYYLKEKFPKINAWVMELLNGSELKEGTLPCQNRHLENWLVFQVKNWQGVLEIIKKSNSFLLIQEVSDQSGELSVGTAAWLGRSFKKSEDSLFGSKQSFTECRNTCLRQVSGHLVLTPRALILGSRSIKRLRVGKRMLTAVLGDFIGRRPKHYRNIQNNVMEAVIAASATLFLNSPDLRQLLLSMEKKDTRKVSYGRIRRQRVIKEILKVLEKKEEAKKHKIELDSKQLSRKPEDFAWTQPEYAMVAEQVLAKMQRWNYSPKQQENSLRLWYDYCSQQQPSFRKADTWIATIIYAISCLEMSGEVRQCDLAKEFEVATSTISANFRSLCKALELVAFDRRYSTLTLPVELKEIDPVLARSVESLYL